MNFIFLVIFGVYVSFACAETNLGTLNTIKTGFATLKECESTDKGLGTCPGNPLQGLEDLLNFTTTNQCIASKSHFKNHEVSIPKCPGSNDQIKGLDNTFPTAGIFALYTGDNDSFIHNLVSNYLEGNEAGRFNLVLPKSKMSLLRNNPELIKVLNSSRVNIIPVDTMPSVDRWMQDSFQFLSVNGKPALYQLEHFRETGTPIKNRLACELARKCNLPYFIPPDMVDPLNKDYNSLNSGGNLEVLPGGTFYTGIIKTEGFHRNLRGNAKVPFRTKFQNIQKKSLESSGNKVLELDTSFLSVGHVDEIINIVKTSNSAPCDYAVLMASPEKAFELMEQTADKVDKLKKDTSFLFHFGDLFVSSAYAQNIIISDSATNRCSEHSYSSLNRDGSNTVISKEQTETIYKNSCIDGEPIERYVNSNEYKILKRENLDSDSPASIKQIMNENRVALIDELRKTTKCNSPQIIPIPVFFRNGLSYTPDLVNGVVHTPPGEPSNVILPRSYFNPFDKYVKEELKKYGVSTTLVHDMGYHLKQGEVHCGTNSARICNL
ncbi:protein-arginine deiminase domain-containing protein [Bacteriovoracaceae bacterium]|nr:protein-arginine deiminase domain-containing protein [Bacteriovoracaceae bacterium]